MIALDYSPFANTRNKYFSSLNETVRYDKARFEQAIFEEVHLFESVDIICSADKKEWDFDTVFLWKGNSLEAGNVGLNGLPINQLLLRKRKKDEHRFEYIKSFDFDVNTQFYEFKDRFIESYEDYVYGIQPAGGSIENPITGETTIAQIETEFDAVWIVGKDTQYKLMYNLEVGDYTTVIPTSITETLGNQFPIMSKSGNVKYRQGNIQCMLVSDGTMNKFDISPKDEKRLRKSIMAFLTDNKPKFFKDGSGESMLISIMNAPTLSPNNSLSQLMYNIQVEFVEVGGISADSLINSGLLEEVR